MSNISGLPPNSTAHQMLPVIIKVCIVIPLVCMFLCCIFVMLLTFATHRQFLDASRYILFIYMLISDAIHFIFSVLLFALVMSQIEFPLVYCVPLLFVSTVTFQNTPLILAAMSLERYIAIVYPLQRPLAWRSDRIWVIILALWLISCLFSLIDLTIGMPDPHLDPFSTPVLCKTIEVNTSPVQILFKAVVSILYIAVVAVIILFTYVRILLETRKLRQDKASVNKAMYTVLLHGFQLVLCVLAFSHPITETLVVTHGWKASDMAFFNYYTFILIPRFLSPLIYGFRDQSLRVGIRKTLMLCSQKVSLHNKSIS
ncbi:odorant receptor 131-2-like [Eucyclogobius newberryi]|uniref:odorant receptor 131-2-like n=1 Tax=Eucyclogobius newberryi TaxID=166745 RepID=UPI003B59C843